ncbi:ABC transporter permease subunit [candidate division KSB1 bacterium]|nr:ABC transporter permease subunit [candidate division KSB1 bacterium]
MADIRHIIHLVSKDLLIELRSKEILLSMIIFSLTIILIFNFTYDIGIQAVQRHTPGLLWVAFIFAGTLGLNRSFMREYENGRMEGLLLCPVSRGSIYIAKLVGNVIFMMIIEMVSLPVMVVLLNLDIIKFIPMLFLLLVLGNIGFASVGTLFSAISLHTRSRELMLPIMLFPVTIPVILAAVKSTAFLLNAKPLAEIMPWVRILIGFDLIFTTLCSFLYKYVVED